MRIPTNYVTKSLLFQYFPFFWNKKQESIFQQVGGSATKITCVLFITSRYFCVFFYKISSDFAFSISERIISHIWAARKYILSVPK